VREIRISIAAVTVILISIGIVMIYSASGIYALEEFGDKAHYLKRHVLFLGIGLILALTVMACDYRDIRPYVKPILLFSIVLLVLVLIPELGKESYGARRWFKIGPFSFQPSELAKLTMLLYTADFLERKGNKIGNYFQGFLPIMFILGIICFLVIKQPDLGNSILLASIVLILLFVAGARLWHLGFLGLLSLPALYFLVATVPYRMRRITAFLDPWQDSQGAGFQLTQSQIALGSGGVFGLGPGQSVQKLFYLPAAHTDFILSIIGEELGLIGTMAVIVLFIIFIWQGARIAKRVTDPFGYYLSLGIVVLLGLQAVVNIGVSIGAFPTKGLPLPFISYGGSSLIFNLIAVAFLLNISRIQDLSPMNKLRYLPLQR